MLGPPRPHRALSLLPQVKQLRLEREREKAMREQELELLQREKEAEHFKTWEEQEDSFHLRQAKLRCGGTPAGLLRLGGWGPAQPGRPTLVRARVGRGHASSGPDPAPSPSTVPRSASATGGLSPSTCWPSTSAPRTTTWPWRCTSPTPSSTASPWPTWRTCWRTSRCHPSSARSSDCLGPSWPPPSHAPPSRPPRCTWSWSRVRMWTSGAT